MHRSAKVFYLGLVALARLFCSPNSVHADTFYVSNYGDNTISKIDSRGNMTVFASTGLNKPMGVALDNSGNLYVANSGDGTIEKFDSSGNGAVFGINVGGVGLVFGSNGNLYSSLLSYDAVIQVTPSGQPVLSSIWNANSPTGLAFDKNGNLYVANESNNTVVEFNSSGQGLIFANSGLNRPIGLAFDSGGNLYVANSGNNTIEKFDPSGNGSLFFKTYTSPAGLAFDSSGNLYAAEPSGFGMEKIDPSGHANFWPEFPSNGPSFIAIQVPEPATCGLLALGIVALLGLHRFRYRPS